MFIVPFIHNVVNHNNIKIHNIKLLTIGSKYLWEEDNNLDIDTDILNPNDIYRKNNIIKFHVIFKYFIIINIIIKFIRKTFIFFINY